MKLRAEEPAFGPWRGAALGELVALVRSVTGSPVGRPRIVAVDGRSAGGKSTLVRRVAAATPATVVVRTDDVAWNLSFFGWADEMARGVLEPLHRGEAVRFRPGPWTEHRREGSIEVPAGTDLVLVEGTGAGRRELSHLVDAVVWVQSDLDEAERRGIARDIAEGVNGDPDGSRAFWRTWMAEEVPFLADHRPWERAEVVVAGTATLPLGEDEVALASPAAPPRGRKG